MILENNLGQIHYAFGTKLTKIYIIDPFCHILIVIILLFIITKFLKTYIMRSERTVVIFR